MRFNCIASQYIVRYSTFTMELEVQHLHRRPLMAWGAIYIPPGMGGKVSHDWIGRDWEKEDLRATYVSLDNLTAPDDLSTGTFLVPGHYCTPKY